MLIERIFLKNKLDNCKFKVINYVYTLLVVVLGWTMFYCNGLMEGVNRIIKMFAFAPSTLSMSISEIIDVKTVIVMVFAIILCGPLQTMIKGLKDKLFDKDKLYILELVIQTALLMLCIAYLAADTYNPFIYFRF